MGISVLTKDTWHMTEGAKNWTTMLGRWLLYHWNLTCILSVQACKMICLAKNWTIVRMSRRGLNKFLTDLVVFVWKLYVLYWKWGKDNREKIVTCSLGMKPERWSRIKVILTDRCLVIRSEQESPWLPQLMSSSIRWPFTHSRSILARYSLLGKQGNR